MFNIKDLYGFPETEEADDFEEKHEKEKPGIELTGYSLVFFKVVEVVLEERGKQQLTTLLQHFLNSCEEILKHCSGMSAFDGPWRRESSTSLSINDAERFVGKDFFNDMACLFEPKLGDTDLTIAQTQQVLGTFFISSLLKLYQEVMLQRLLQTKLRNLAEHLKTYPILSTNESQRLEYILAIFRTKVSDYKELQENTQQQFEAIFQDLASKNNTAFLNLVTLFFLKPFPFEIIQNAHFILNHPELIVDRLEPFMKRLESSEQKSLKRSQQGKNKIFIAKHATHIKTAFETLTTALKTVSDERRIQILNKDTISNEFIEIIQIQTATVPLVKIDEQDESEGVVPIKTIGNDNFIFQQYFLAVHLKIFQKNDFDNVFETSLVDKAIQAINPQITQMLDNRVELKPFLKLMSSKNPADKIVLAPKESLLHTLDITAQEGDKFALLHLKYATGKRRCCNPRDRETLSALLNANPLVKALLLSQVPIAVVLQILRVNDTFKDVSTVMWFEPFLGLLGFSGGVYALRNPKTLVNTLFRTLEALSASAVVLSKCLEIAILVHTTLLPAESRSGGMDLERFLTRVASIPMALALLSLAYNSISPNFKKRCCSKGVRRAFDFINYSTIHWGLYQIIRTDIIKIVSKFETPGFSSDLDKWLFECFSAIPALVFAFTRVAPICASKRDAVGGNISETLNTAALYGFTIALGMKLIIDLYFSGSDNLPIEQTNFRRVFFPILLFASTAVMARFGRSFREFYEGNPEVIVLKISKADTLPDSNVPLLSLQEVKKLDEALEAPLDSQQHLEGRTILKLYDRHLHASKLDNILNNKGKRTRCCVVS